MHQNRSHHHHGTAEGSFTAKKWFGHRAGRSPCTHSIGKFFLCYIVLFSSETSAPGSPGNYLYNVSSYSLALFVRIFLLIVLEGSALYGSHALALQCVEAHRICIFSHCPQFYSDLIRFHFIILYLSYQPTNQDLVQTCGNCKADTSPNSVLR